MRKNPFILFGGFALAVFIMAIIFGPLILSHSPYETNIKMRHAPPSAEHWLGTDELGRDTLARIIYGGRNSLYVGVVVVSLSFCAGVLLGGVAGYKGGWTDEAIMRLTDIVMAFPGIILVIALASVLGPGINHTILALSVTGWTGYARVMRVQVLRLKEMDYCEAERALGAGNFRIFFRHILPNSLAPLIVQATFGMAGVIVAEASLSFLGLGVQPPAASWGEMLAGAREHIASAHYVILFTTLALMLTLSAFYSLGEGFRRALDPKNELASVKN